MNPDAYGLWQIASPMRSDMSEFGPDRINVVSSPHTPPGKAYVIGVDPSDDDPAMVVMVDEASEFFADVARRGRKTGLAYTDWAYQQFPSLERFVEQYSKFVPQEINNPKEKEYTMDMAGLARMRSDLENMLTKFTSMVSIVERFGGEPGDGTVIKFEHTFGDTDKVYDYVAIRKFGKWYVSGRPFGGSAVGWQKLLEFIGEGRAWVAESWREAPMPGRSAEVVGADMVATFASVLSNSSGKDTKEVAEQLAAIVEKSK